MPKGNNCTTCIPNICSGKFLVKWQLLDYKESTWESEETLNDLPDGAELIEKYQYFQKRAKKKARKSKPYIPPDSKLDGVRTVYKKQPPFLKKGLYPYQLTGLNFLHSSWEAKRNVILGGKSLRDEKN